jgi:DNA polymerase I-like protein with 3'-5' exonuclease and polymerase domains
MQNITERHRNIFVADPGMELAYLDYKQGESNIVSHLSGDEGYIDAHLTGDVHTYATRLIWPDLPWTGDLAADKKIAKVNPDWDTAPGHDYRFQAKRIQHGGNYGLSPFGIAIIAHIPVSAAKTAYYAYHAAFPDIKNWQGHVEALVAAGEPLVNPLGIKVRLYGRPWDGRTVKQGLAFLPQSALAHIINIAAWLVWRELDMSGRGVMLLAQVHDALLVQFPAGRYDLLREVAELMRVPVEVTDYKGNIRTMVIDVEAAVGQNWGHRSADNPKGIKEMDV